MPVMWRAPGLLQLGLPGQPCLTLQDPPQGTATVLTALRHPRTLADLGRLVPSFTPGGLHELLESLTRHGLLRTIVAAPVRLAVIGSGSVARAIASLLEGLAPVRDVVRIASGPVDAEASRSPAPTPVGGWRSVAATDWPTLSIIASEAHEPDRGLTDHLTRLGRAHLVVRLQPGRAIVGPFVVPGSAPCLRCSDLSATSADPAWPRLLAQLCSQSDTVDPLGRAWAATTTAAQVSGWWAEGSCQDTIGRTLELDLADATLHSRSWQPHPECGCQRI